MNSIRWIIRYLDHIVQETHDLYAETKRNEERIQERNENDNGTTDSGDSELPF